MSPPEAAEAPAEAAVRERLRAIPEPCSLLMRAPTNIIDMGLVGRLDVDGGTVSVELVLTDPSCIHFGSMRRFIRDALMEIDGVSEVEVRASRSHLWTPDRVRGGADPSANFEPTQGGPPGG